MSNSTAPIWNMYLAENENNANQTDFKNVQALSQKVITNGLSAHGSDLFSLAYLFDPKQKLEGNVKQSYENVTGLFQIDEQGYYYYNAFENFAEFKKAEPGTTTRDGKPSDGSFILYDSPAVWRSDAGWKPSSTTDPNEGKFNGDPICGNFYPFNTGKQVFDVIDADNNKLSSNENMHNGNNWDKEKHFTNNVTNKDFYINHHIGMSMTIDFTQPEDGKLNMGSAGKQDMVFQFSGDDDVWVFIDDVLVLDLGGMHSALYGTIDFGTGKVVTGQSWRTNGLLPNNPGHNPGDNSTTLYEWFEKAGKANDINWTQNDQGAKIFATGSRHTLKLFYLERGNYDSTLQMRFNLLPSLYHGIKKVDQNGDPLKGAEFELYAAELKEGKTDIGAENIGKYNVDDYKVKGGLIGTMTTDEEGNASYIKSDGSPFSFLDQYNSDGTLYYIMRESKAPEGYRSLPKDILLRFDSDSSMLIVANRYQSGAYSSFFSSIRETGYVTYGQFNEENGNIEANLSALLGQESKKSGLIVAVPMLLEKNEAHEQAEGNGKWTALYGSNIDGYGAVAPERRTAEAWRKAVLKAALYQASSDTYPQWYIPFNGDKMKLEGTLEEFPGRADRYALIKGDNADMKMVYGVIEPSALASLGITGNTSQELYNNLKAAIIRQIEKERYGSKERSGMSSEEKKENAINSLIAQLNISSVNFADRDFSFLNTDQFQREFRSTIYIPNERRELRVWKTDDEGKGINGAEFTLFDDEGNEITKGVTATIEGRDGVLILMPDPPKDDRGKVKQGYADARWMTLDSNDPNHLAHYILKETKAPAGHELNPTEIPVYVGIYSIYADAGTADNGVTVMAGVGKLMQTMTKYAADDMVNITLRDITAFAQKQSSGHFSLSGWQDDKLSGVKPEIGEIIRSMDLHYGINAVIDYGLHDEDGGQNYYPFFTTDVGFLRTRIEQNTDALEGELFGAHKSNANWDNLRNMDLTNLFTQLNTVVVTNKKTNPETDTGKLCLSKVVTGEGTDLADYKKTFPLSYP